MNRPRQPALTHQRSGHPMSCGTRVVGLAGARIAARIGFAFGIVVTGLLPSCQAPTHADIQQDAQDRWTDVRAGIKRRLARQSYESKQFEEAIRVATEAIGLDPAAPDGHEVLALAYLETGKTFAADQALQLARHIGARSPALIYTEGVVLELQGQLESALAKYSRARELDPTQSDFVMAQAECLVELDRPVAALELLNDSRNRVADVTPCLFLRAHIELLVGDRDAAIRSFNEALNQLGESNIVAEELGPLLASAGRYEEARSLMEPLLESSDAGKPTGAVRRALARTMLALGEPRGAVAALDRYARENLTDLAAQLLLAEAAILSDDGLTALRTLGAAARLAPKRRKTQLLLATVHWRRGDYASAATVLFDRLANDAGDVDAHCMLAEVMSASNQPNAAREHFNTALQLDDECEWASYGLARLPSPESPRQQAKLTSAANPATKPSP